MKKQIINKLSLTLVSLLIFASVYVLFGKENIVLAFAVIIAIMNLAKKDFTIKPKYEFIKLLVGFISLSVCAQLVNSNIYLGIVLNIVFLYIIGALYLDDLDNRYYYVFTNLYLYTLLFSVGYNQFPLRLAGIVFCVIIIMILKLYVIKVNYKNNKINLLTEIIDIIDLKIENILDIDYKNELDNKLEKLINSLDNILNNSRDSKGNFMYEDKYIFDLLTMLEKINMEIDKSKCKNNKYLLNLNKNLLDIMKDFIKNKISIDEAIGLLQTEKDKILNNENKYRLNICLIELIIMSITGYSKKAREKENIVNAVNQIISPSRIINKIIYSYREKEETFYFNIRMILAITIPFAVGRLFNIEYYYWIVLSSFVVIQANLKDTISKSFKRLKGTAIGAGVSIIIFQYISNMNIKIALMIVAIFCMTLFKSYDKLMIFTTICTLGAKDILNPNILVMLDRLLFVFIGVLIAILITYIIRPYKFSNECNKKLLKIKDNDKKIFSIIKNGVEGRENFNYNNLRELMLQNKLMINYLNNIIGDKKQYNESYKEFKLYHNRISVNAAFLYKLFLLKEKVDLDNYLKKELISEIKEDIDNIFKLKTILIK
ncbi:MAG: FUSC family protein [Clostridium baratii]|uniref:FUSC family protein n=1 Tax=Clostridium baratii TaxID=1561 RepID=UPI0006C33A76|nr:FUSC family protein [Clostridium baratii]MBS6007185.1 FUSC family protein [Clostridium baratii]MDU1054057.1 FUSC family protein [Clostridium baratii]CUP49349.1 membrane protein [Clostridium baratii]